MGSVVSMASAVHWIVPTVGMASVSLTGPLKTVSLTFQSVLRLIRVLLTRFVRQIHAETFVVRITASYPHDIVLSDLQQVTHSGKAIFAKRPIWPATPDVRCLFRFRRNGVHTVSG